MLKYRNNAAIAHIAPLVVFLLLTSVVPLLAVKNSALPWWRSAPEHWIYPLQTIICGGLLAFFWKNYTFRPARGFLLATLLGVAGIMIWILPGWLYSATDWKHDENIAIPLLGFTSRTEGFNPTIFDKSPFWFAIVICFRFIRLIVVVPLIEEIFWRGFLMRYVVAGHRPFKSVPFGTHTWKAFGVTTAALMLVHAKEDWVGALVFGSLMYFLCIRSKSLGACVWMHAVANLLLGIYVLKTRQWGFW
ncbi:MAG: CAAX prenyl protease-related protein [Verrucomicrobia bacterium]|nr:CAAX prenyl protease-related protein [Verrucomicrobiota bacterium]